MYSLWSPCSSKNSRTPSLSIACASSSRKTRPRVTLMSSSAASLYVTSTKTLGLFPLVSDLGVGLAIPDLPLAFGGVNGRGFRKLEVLGAQPPSGLVQRLEGTPHLVEHPLFLRVAQLNRHADRGNELGDPRVVVARGELVPFRVRQATREGLGVPNEVAPQPAVGTDRWYVTVWKTRTLLVSLFLMMAL